MRDAASSLATFGLVTALSATAAAAVPAAPDVELVRPAPDEALAAGTDAVVEWRARGPLDPAIEEWEAFLSFDGGGHYAVRITPHLDLSRRRFAFRVPDLATGEARILLRFGDEKREVGVEVPHTFSILPAALPLARRGLPAPDRGEPARPGEAGVVAWVDGSRRGQGLTRYEARSPRCTGASVSPGLAEPGSVLTRRTETPAPAPAASPASIRRVSSPPAAADLPRPPAPILLLACRQNE